MAPPIRIKPSFPFSPSLPSGNFHKPLILLYQRADWLKKHNHRKLTNLITWTTTLSDSMTLWAMLCRATQDGWVMVESSDKTWSIEEGNGKPLQYSCLENPMNRMKRRKREDSERWTSQVCRCPISPPEISGEITPERMKRQIQSKNNTQLWIWLIIEVKSDVVKGNIAQEPGTLGPWVKAN